MPLLSIETNQAPKSSDTLSIISKKVASMLDKPESYLMLKYEKNTNMLFAGSNEPLAHIKVKSLGLAEDQTSKYSSELCQLIQDHFDVPVDRVYIEFSNPPRHLWGWNSTTF